MTNIWSFLAQTLAASVTAALLLVVKRLFQDKLSPRWQYGIWAVLWARLLLPTGLGGRYVLCDWRLWLEAAKTAVERRLSSALSAPFALTEALAPVPLFSHGFPAPGSVTDLLFYLYAAGVVLSLLWFFLSYLGLRRALWGAAAPDGATLAQIEAVCRRYGLEVPRRVAVLAGAETAFVCGPLRPVLVLPADRAADGKVLLHELLHLKYGDVWAGVLICVLRCLHWCNPLIWYCCDRAQNDCEALCDQRVLERLEGEERRDYGRILLSMADSAHARAPGTSSMANGGRNIRQRIQTIARFKRYPSGMALASLCVAAALGLTCLVGTAEAVPVPGNRASGALDLARARLNRPSTPAGALDTYVKALLGDSLVYLSMAAPADRQAALYEAALAPYSQDGAWMDTALPWDDSPFFRERYTMSNGAWQAEWFVLNLLPDGAGGCRGLLFLRPAGSDGPARPLAQTVHLRPDGPAWTVTAESSLEATQVDAWSLFGDPGVPAATYTAQAGGLRIEIDVQAVLAVDNTQIQRGGTFSFLDRQVLDPLPRPDTPFTEYRHAVGGRAWDLQTGESVRLGVRLSPLSTDGTEGGCGAHMTLPEALDGGGGGFSFSQGVGLDCVAALALEFSYLGEDYACVALPGEVTP